MCYSSILRCSLRVDGIYLMIVKSSKRFLFIDINEIIFGI